MDNLSEYGIFQRVIETARARRAQAVCEWFRASGRDPSRQLPWAWHNYRAWSTAKAVRRADEDVRLVMFL
jgi:hypothetical protein